MSDNELRIRMRQAAILLVLILGTACTPSGSAIKIEPSMSALQVNDMAQVPVTAENIANLVAYEVHLSFDVNTLEVMELKDGGFVKADFVVQNVFDNTAGTIDYAVAQINNPPANGDGILFEIVFRAKALGKSPILFRETQAAPAGVLLADPNGMAIEVSLINGSLDIEE